MASSTASLSFYPGVQVSVDVRNRSAKWAERRSITAGLCDVDGHKSMGSDYGRRRAPISRDSLCRTALFAGVLPFSLGLIIILAVYRHKYDPLGAATSQSARSLVTCPPDLSTVSPPLCNCSNNTRNVTWLPEPPDKQHTESVHKVPLQAAAIHPGSLLTSLNAATRPDLFLFVGILSGRGYRHRRLAVREAWFDRAQQPGVCVCKFILSEDESTPQVQKEVEAHDDIIFVKEKTNYKTILYKTYFVLEHAFATYNVSFILKTDDDAFVNVAALISQLRLLCQTAACKRERIYMGKMAKESEVLLQPGHKWNNMVFYNHTGLKQYPNYMMGGGYIVSGDVAGALVNTHTTLKLKFTPIEDATMGFWLMSMDLRHVDHNRFFTWGAPCCFKAPVRREGQKIVTRFQLQEDMDENMCSDDPWLVLHKVDSPTKMRYIGTRVQACNASDPTKIAPSLQPYVQPQDAIGAHVLPGTNRRR